MGAATTQTFAKPELQPRKAKGTIASYSGRKISFNNAPDEIVEVKPYSAHYPLHPSLLVATDTGFKRLAAHADRSTGKKQMQLRTLADRVCMPMTTLLVHVQGVR